jgi:hypothetical protein
MDGGMLADLLVFAHAGRQALPKPGAARAEPR